MNPEHVPKNYFISISNYTISQDYPDAKFFNHKYADSLSRTSIINIGTVVLYPDPQNFIPSFSQYDYVECTPPPIQTGPSTCFTNVFTEFQPPYDGCTPEDGLFIWEAFPDFFTAGDVSVCYHELIDTIYIAPCPNIPSNGTLSIKKN